MWFGYSRHILQRLVSFNYFIILGRLLIYLSNECKSGEDKAEDDKLLDDSTIVVYPESNVESVEPHNQCFFDPDFPDQKSLLAIVERHGQVLFQPFDQEGLRVDSLHLESGRTQRSGCSPAGSSGAIFWGLIK